MNHAKLYHYTIFFILTSLLYFPITSFSQDNQHAFNLEECIAYGLEHNVTVQNATFDEYIAQKDVNELLASGFPQVSAEASGQYNYALPVFVLPGANGELQSVTFGLPLQATAGATITQLVADGVYFVGLEASKAFVRLSEKVTQQSKEEIAYAISTAFYTVLASKEQAKLIDANLERLNELFKETKALQEEGFVEKLDVERLEINRYNLEIEKQKLDRFEQLTIEMLKFQMGMSIEASLTLVSPEIDLSEMPGVPEEFLLENKIEYQILQDRLRLEGYNLKRHKVSYFPSLYAFGNYSLNRQWESGTENEFNYDVGAVGLQLSIPIFDGTRKRNLVQKSKITIRKIENEITQFTEGNKLERRQAEINYNNAVSSLENYEKTQALAKKVYDVSRIKYKEGVGSSLEINQAETALKEAEINHVRGTYNVILAKLELQKAYGQFSAYH